MLVSLKTDLPIYEYTTLSDEITQKLCRRLLLVRNLNNRVTDKKNVMHFRGKKRVQKNVMLYYDRLFVLLNFLIFSKWKRDHMPLFKNVCQLLFHSYIEIRFVSWYVDRHHRVVGSSVIRLNSICIPSKTSGLRLYSIFALNMHTKWN